MAALVKIEIPEPSEFDVYLDVDGAEDGIQDIMSDGDSESAPLLDGSAEAVGAPSQSSDAKPQVGPSGGDMQPEFQPDIKLSMPTCSFDTYESVTHEDGVDEIELDLDDDPDPVIDVETPFDGKQLLLDQTESVAELVRHNHISTDTVLTFAKKSTSTTSMSTVQELVSLEKVGKNVSRKSTTPRQPGKIISNVAKKSTSKQSQIVTSKQSQIVTQASTKTLLPEYKAHHASSVGQKLLFTFRDRGEDQMNCPECGIRMLQRSMRKHLRNIHNLFIRTCNKCKVSFSDLDLFSEHYALHLQHEENIKSGLQSQPVRLLNLTATESASPASKTTVKKSASGIYSGDVLPGPQQSKASPKHNILAPAKKQVDLSTKNDESSSSRYQGGRSLRKETCHRLQPESSSNAENPPDLRKRHLTPSPAKGASVSWSSASRKTPRPRSSSPESLQSKASFSSDLSEPNPSVSTHCRDNHKMAVRRGQTVCTKYEQTPDKQGMCEVITVLVSRRYCEEAKVSLVSLETASQPYNCKTCLAAFHTALTCPQSFRQLTQKPNSKDPANLSHSDEHRAHQISLDMARRKVTAEMDTSSTETHPQTCLKSSNTSAACKGATSSSHLKNPAPKEINNQCKICGKKFQYPYQVLRHAAYHSFRYRCGACKKVFKEKMDLLNHFQIVHGGRSRMLCRYCEREFEEFDDLENHVFTHKDGTEVACTVCDQIFSESKLMQLHLKSVHGGSDSPGKPMVEGEETSHLSDKYACKLCDQKFSMSQKLAVHVKMVHGSPYSATKLMSCRICGKIFHKKNNLLSHYKNVHHMSVPEGLSLTGPKRAFISKVKPKVPVSPLKNMLASQPVAVRKTIPSKIKNKNVAKIQKKSIPQKKSMPVSSPRKISSVMCAEGQKKDTSVPSPQKKSLHHSTGTQVIGARGSKCPICQRIYTSRKGMLKHVRRLHHSVSVSSDTSVPSPQKKSLIHGTGTQVIGARGSKSVPSPQKKSLIHGTGTQVIGARGSKSVPSPQKKSLIHDTGTQVIGARGSKCPICQRIYTSRKGMLKHVRRLHHSVSVSSENLGLKHRVSTSVKQKSEDLKSQYSILSAAKVGKKKDTSSFIKKIAQRKKGALQCLKCHKIFTQHGSLSRHMRIFHGKTEKTNIRAQAGTWGCTVCGSFFSTRTEMRDHKKSSHHERQLGSNTCKCGQVFMVKTQFLDHIDKCGRITSALSKPVPDKTGKVHPCQTCEKRFSSKQNLARHMKSHHMPAASVVDTSCGDNGNFHHANANSKILCKICNSCFTDKSLLKRHQQRVHSGKSGFYQCRKHSCQKIFDRSSRLLNHVNADHPNMSPYHCWGCRTGFDSDQDVYDHKCIPVSSMSAKQKKELSELEPSTPEMEVEPCASEKAVTSTSQIQEVGHCSSDMPTVKKSCSQVLKILLSNYNPPKTEPSLMSEQESCHRCTKCDLGFHTACKLATHVQEHAVTDDSNLNNEPVIDATENIQWNICDAITADGAFICQFCEQRFTSKDALALHSCEKSKSDVNSFSSKPSFEKKNVQCQQIKCIACLQFFSPLSIRRHMINIHSLPMLMCKQCNIVFTDIKHFGKHCQIHKQQKSIALEGAVENSNADNAFSPNDDACAESSAYFVCSHCDGYFNNSSAVKLHNCGGEDTFCENTELRNSDSEDPAVSEIV